MALTRKFLTALGIEADKIDEIITAHTESTDALKEQRDKYKADADKLPGIQKELDDLKAAKGDDDAYKEKYDKEHEAFEAYKKDQTAKETKAKKQEAYKELLKEAGVSEKHINAVLRVSDVDSLELDDDGKVKDSKDKIDSIEKEWSDFIVEKGSKGADTHTPPAGDGNATGSSGEGKKIWQQYQSRYGVQPQENNSNNNNDGGNE